MEISESGVVLYTLAYAECVSFYERVLELAVLYRKSTLTCFQFGGGYLMVEIDDQTHETEARRASRDRFCLRLNVPDVQVACLHLDAHDVPYEYGEYDWGTVAKFRDPDGNRVAFRSASEHRRDCEAATP